LVRGEEHEFEVILNAQLLLLFGQQVKVLPDQVGDQVHEDETACASGKGDVGAALADVESFAHRSLHFKDLLSGLVMQESGETSGHVVVLGCDDQLSAICFLEHLREVDSACSQTVVVVNVAANVDQPTASLALAQEHLDSLQVFILVVLPHAVGCGVVSFD
jgi:hypothetical protein